MALKGLQDLLAFAFPEVEQNRDVRAYRRGLTPMSRYSFASSEVLISLDAIVVGIAIVGAVVASFGGGLIGLFIGGMFD